MNVEGKKLLIENLPKTILDLGKPQMKRTKKGVRFFQFCSQEMNWDADIWKNNRKAYSRKCLLIRKQYQEKGQRRNTKTKSKKDEANDEIGFGRGMME